MNSMQYIEIHCNWSFLQAAATYYWPRSRESRALQKYESRLKCTTSTELFSKRRKGCSIGRWRGVLTRRLVIRFWGWSHVGSTAGDPRPRRWRQQGRCVPCRGPHWGSAPAPGCCGQRSELPMQRSRFESRCSVAACLSACLGRSATAIHFTGPASPAGHQLRGQRT